MEEILNELEVSPRSVIMQAARQFAEAFSELAEYQSFERAFQAFRNDSAAQKALEDFQKKQASLKALIMLNSLSDEERQELLHLQDLFYSKPTVMSYLQAQRELVAISQSLGDLISTEIGLDYGTSCRTGGCCG